MTHRTFTIGERPVDIFDSRVAADLFLKRHDEDADLTVLIRNHSLFMRRGALAMTVSLRKPVEPNSPPPIVAARAIADEAERMIEKATADALEAAL